MDGRILVNTYRFDEIFNEIIVTQHKHVVLDVQGAELMVLKGFGTLLNYISSIKVEVSTYEVYLGGASYFELRSFLVKQGFTPLWEPQEHSHTDILFVKIK